MSSEVGTKKFIKKCYAAADMLYASGDHALASELYGKCAELGHVDSQVSLAYMYYYGEGVEQDLGLAFEWFKTAAVAENSYAQYALYIMIKEGDCPDEEKEDALKWIEASAKNGYPIAINELGCLYLMGEDVEKNEKKAFKYFGKVAEFSDFYAGNIGALYYTGTGVKKNRKKGLKLLVKAVKEGNPVAMQAYDLAISDEGLAEPLVYRGDASDEDIPEEESPEMQ